MGLRKIVQGANVPLASASLFFVIGIVCIFLTRHAPLHDFGNYYYGSRLLLDGKFNGQLYASVHTFNSLAAGYGETSFFGNYIPVPPFTALAYTPFCLFAAPVAKLIFNLLGLLLFCRGVYRLLFWLRGPSQPGLLLLPIVFVVPLLNNMMQGQAYLFIIALLIEAFLLSERGWILLPALLLALCISLKLFPVFMLLYFFIRKKYKIVWLSLSFSLFLFLIPILFVGTQPVTYYCLQVLPRLFNNDVVGPYYPGNQSVYTALLDLFSYDGLSNPMPLMESKFLIVCMESVCIALLLVISIGAARKEPLSGFAIPLAACLLVSRYNTSYSLILLLPMAIYICRFARRSQIIFLTLLFLAVSVPVTRLMHLPFAVKYARLILLLIVFFGVYLYSRWRLNSRLLLGSMATVFILKYFTFPIRQTNYFQVQNTSGILYDLRVKRDTLTLLSTLGSRDTSEVVILKGNMHVTEKLKVTPEGVYYDRTLLKALPGNKCCPFVYNDSTVVFMSDLNQAVGFYKLQFIPLHK